MTPRPDRLSARRALLVAGASSPASCCPPLRPWPTPATGSNGVGDGMIHPISGPDHLLAMAPVGAVAAFACSRRVAWLTPLAFVGGMLVGGVLGLAGLSLPGTETAIAVSVVALGVLVATAARRDGLWLPVLVGALRSWPTAWPTAPRRRRPPRRWRSSPVSSPSPWRSTPAGHWPGLALRRAPRRASPPAPLVSGAGLALLAGV